MHIAVLFYMDTVRQSLGKPENVWGRVIANHGFLLQLAAAEDIGRLAVFVPAQRDIEQLNASLLKDIPRTIDVVSFLEIPEYLERSPIDVLHCLDPNLFLAGHIRRHFSARPFAITGITHSLGNDHFLTWALLNNANGIGDGDTLICTTPTARQVVESATARLAQTQPDFRAPRTRVIPLGTTLADPVASTTVDRRDLQLGEDDFVLLSLSRFDPLFKMDLVPLLHLLQMANERSTRPVRLILAGSAGDGGYVKAMEQLVDANGLSSSVRLLPNLGEEQKTGIFALADAFLSLSDNIQETFGLTVIEALAAGLPVIASDWDGYKALVSDGETGYLVPSMALAPDAQWEAGLTLQFDNATHLFLAQTTAVDLPRACRAILGLQDDPARRKQMGDAARKSAAQYDWRVVMQAYLQLWTELVSLAAATERGDPRSSGMLHQTDFSSYATSRLTPGSRFQTGPFGRLLLQGKKQVNFYPHTEQFLDLPLMAKILNFYQQCGSVSDMLDALGAATAAPPLKLQQNLMWLYKYGYVEIETDDTAAV